MPIYARNMGRHVSVRSLASGRVRLGWRSGWRSHINCTTHTGFGRWRCNHDRLPTCARYIHGDCDVLVRGYSTRAATKVKACRMFTSSLQKRGTPAQSISAGLVFATFRRSLSLVVSFSLLRSRGVAVKFAVNCTIAHRVGTSSGEPPIRMSIASALRFTLKHRRRCEKPSLRTIYIMLKPAEGVALTIT